MPKVLTRDEYQFRVRQKVDALKARSRNPGSFISAQAHGEIRRYFANRAIQLGEACFRIYDLDIPLAILARVLCEDLIRLSWALQSDQNATEFERLAISELTRVLRANLIDGRARIRDIKTGADVTKVVLPVAEDFIAAKKTVSEMARETGLSKLYDVVYRYGSLTPHALTFGLGPEEAGRDPILATLSATNGVLGLITLTLDEPTPPTAKELLDILGLGKIGGK